jgi:biotin-dependent carboxylase-like uncharacterized protein
MHDAMTGLLIESCGAGTTLQDWGRTGLRRFGVATAGAADRLSLALANALVGNNAATAAVEFALLGASFRVQGGAVTLAVAGPDCALRIAGRAVAPGTSARAEAGQRVEVGPVRGGVYAYLAVAGGFDLAPEMGSLSMHRRSGIGGRGLQGGALLTCAGPVEAPLRRIDPLPRHPGGAIRVIAGPQQDFFTPQAFETFLASEYAVTPLTDRMGCRLLGPPLQHQRGFNIVSDGVLAGSIQVPGDGQPLVLLRDCQTTGGYPKIATVIGADIDRLGQMPPGSRLRFVAVSRDQAVAAARQAHAAIVGLAALARPLGFAPESAHLLAHNLIGGVVDCRAEPD